MAFSAETYALLKKYVDTHGAGGISFDPEQTYPEGSIGAALSQQSATIVNLDDTKVNYTDKLSTISGVMTDAEKTALWQRQESIKTTMDSVAVAGAQYYLGELSTLNITLPQEAVTGQQIVIVFYSGSAATTLTISECLGDVPVPSANSRYELNFEWDGTNWSLLYAEQDIPQE